MLEIIQTINKYLSDYVLTALLVSTGLYFTVITRFVQVRCFGDAIKHIFSKKEKSDSKQKGSMSSFQALSTAVAAQVGTGNIVGASGAILVGGPGAIFWMWIIAFFGMSTIYAEAVLAQKTRKINSDGTISGGPVYYITTAFKGRIGKFLAGFFAVSAVLALGFMGVMTQSNSIGSTFSSAFSVPPYAVGIVIAAAAGFVFVGDVKRIASVTEKIVPFMAILYIVGCLAVVVARIKFIPETFGLIFKYAFQPNAIIGGGFGYAFKLAISQGVKRGLFSNEAGMGSTPHAHALATVEKPHDQGLAAMFGVFVDTFVVLSLTAIVVVSTLYAGNGVLSNGFAEGVKNTNMVQLAFSSVFGEKFGSMFVAICLFFFAFSTIISWNLFGKINFRYLFKSKAVIIYSVIAIAFTFIGSVAGSDMVWELQDMFNQLIVIPNVIALFALASVVKKEFDERKIRPFKDENTGKLNLK